MKYVLDTNSLIYALNDGAEIPLYDYQVSVITEIELLSYAKLSQQDEDDIREMLSNFQIISLTDRVKETTIEIRRIIVATAIENEAILVTSDKQLLKLDCVQTMEMSQLRV